MIDTAIALLAIVLLEILFPVAAVVALCKRRNRTPLYFRSISVALVAAYVFVVLLTNCFGWAEYQATHSFQFPFCQSNRWVCALTDTVLGNSLWLTLLGAAVLTCLSLLALFILKPDFASRHAQH